MEPKVYYRVHKPPPLPPILSQINPVHTALSYLSKIHLYSHLLQGLSSDLFPSGFPTKILYAFLFSPCYMPRPSHSPWLDLFNYTWRTVQVMKLIMYEEYFHLGYDAV
jgi:hypothetical protein